MRRRRSAAGRVLAATAAAELLAVEGLFAALPLAVCAAALFFLPLRRRLPLTTLCATLPAMLTGHMWLPSMVAMLEMASGRSRHRTAVACALLFAAAACPWPVWEFASMTRQEILTSVEAAALMSTGPTALGLLVATRGELRARLAELTATREREQHLESERAVARERARLAREMHDTIAHHVGIIAVQAGALRAAETDAWKRDTAESIRRHGVQALEELRDMVGVLRASDPAAARSAGRTGLDGLRDLADGSLLEVALDVAELRTAPAGEVENAVFRIVQESLNNVRKHAPGARVAVRVAPGPDGCSLTVEVGNSAPPGAARPPAPHPGPDPAGAGLPGGGYGLVGLRERAELLGGSLSATRSPEGGFLVRAVLPL
ncbi:histidine kinase [Streptomyces sp. MRC013]|uniref:sensor histidine kinase n=1 Tax=Streptomyces sp. MRC013 TaxID=2898276 RepID=UPI002027619B|nr:histidine kinase [Streptomyces sp. MRC013]URM89637.1 histidine kinase [Streptomyces sp. MRC013]